MRALPVPSITIKNLPANLHRRLRQRADSSGRSLNREIIACLLEAAGAERVDARALLAEVRPLRRLVRGQVSDAEVTAAKREGRRRSSPCAFTVGSTRRGVGNSRETSALGLGESGQVGARGSSRSRPWSRPR